MNLSSGVTVFDREKAFHGYTLWSPLSFAQNGAEEPGALPGRTFLMDMEGNIVHEWTLPYPLMYAHLLPDGHLLAGLRTTSGGPGRPGVREQALGGTQGALVEADWDGTVLFMHEDPAMHHDFRKLPNGNYAYLAWEPLPPETAAQVLGGRADSGRDIMWCDVIREIDPSGTVVWEWHAKDHLSFSEHIIGPIYARHEWSHFNDLSPCENGDYICSSRFLDCAFRISRSTGEITRRIGTASFIDERTGRIALRVDRNTLAGPHDAHIIPRGLPGEGHLLCYDNGVYSFVSRAVEFDMETGEAVWQSNTLSFLRGRVPFSCFISSARRLPNGNTILCEGANGIFQEITYDGELVWEYVKPMDEPPLAPYSVFRCFRYAPGYCPQFAQLPPAGGSV